jgi:hypothetical protein
MNYRTAFVIDIIKRRVPPDFYDHRTAKFVSLDKPEMQKEGFDLNRQINKRIIISIVVGRSVY